MITPELTRYIKGEFAKGRTREEVHVELVGSGGWSEIDLNEAFRSVLPMNNLSPNYVIKSFPPAPISPRFWRVIIVIIIVCGFGFAVWFYRAPLISFWNIGINKSSELFTSFFNKQTTTTKTTINTVPINNPVTIPVVNVVKDCGVSVAPDVKNPLAYKNDAVLSCLGNSALQCEDARAVLNDPLFPTIFQITKGQDISNQETCNFRLSYGEDSTLTDITGKKLALQYISCPLSIVKAVDESKKVSVFKDPSIENFSKYASQIYFYGTLGLFMENNVDQNKIEGMGCSGEYISSVIASYRKMQSQK